MFKDIRVMFITLMVKDGFVLFMWGLWLRWRIMVLMRSKGHGVNGQGLGYGMYGEVNG